MKWLVSFVLHRKHRTGERALEFVVMGVVVGGGVSEH